MGHVVADDGKNLMTRLTVSLIMKLPKNVLVWAAILSASVAPGAEQPLARLSVRSYTDLTNAISRLASSFNPNGTEDPGLKFNQGLGLTNLGALDTKRPWEIALWHGGGGEQPLVAIKAPVQDVTQFKESLSPAGVLRSKGQDWSQLTNGLALIVFRKSDSLSEGEKSALDEWKSQVIAPPARLVELKVSMSEPLREQAVGMVSIGKTSVSRAFASQSSQMGNALNPAAMEGMLAVCFDTIQTFIAGLQEVTLGLDLSSDALTVEECVTAKPGTDLAKWLQKPAGQVTAQDLNWVDPDASLAIGAYCGKDPALLKLVQRMTQVGLQMQDMETNGPAAKDLEDLMAKLLPAVFAGSVEVKDKFAFAGAYRFPGANVAETYAEMKRFATNSFQTFVGKDKMYSAGSLAEKHHTIDGVTVDRFTLTINLDSPLFKLPGQKEQLQAVWPDGKMEIDYALKDDRMLVASGDRMKELLERGSGKPNRKATLKLGEGTVLTGYMNLLSFVRQMSAANPAIPEAVKEKLAKLEGQGTGIEFQVRADEQMHSSGRVPLKLFRELGRLKGD